MTAITSNSSPRRSRAAAMPQAAEMEVAACPAPKTSYSDSSRRRKPESPPLRRMVGSAVVAAGEDLVRVGLVADVPDELVARGLEDAVEGDRQLHRAEVGPEVGALVAGDHVDDALAHLGGERLELVLRQRAQFGGRADLIEKRHGDDSC